MVNEIENPINDLKKMSDALAQNHLEYIVLNPHEFHYALYGSEKGFLNQFFIKSTVLKAK